jgi:hypothetical protein
MRRAPSPHRLPGIRLKQNPWLEMFRSVRGDQMTKSRDRRIFLIGFGTRNAVSAREF